MACAGLLADRYAITGELGRGASGRVFRAVDRADGEAPRALKLVAPADAARLGWEFGALCRVEHPNLARVYELLRVDRASSSFELPEGSVVLVSALAEGRTADLTAAELRRDRAAALRLVLGVADGVSRALSALHANGLIHGDVKPTNIVVSDDLAHCTLIDLGLAQEQSGASHGLSGTPAYMAPELFRGERTPGADVYALGVTLHELLIGAPELEGRSLSFGEHMRRALRPAAARTALPEATPPALRRLIEAMLDPDPDARLRPASEIRARVAAIAEELGLAAYAGVGGGADAAPSAIEQAAAIAALPFVGLAPALDALSAALAFEGPRLLVVRGPRGSGRSRLVREAVRRLQVARLAADLPVPSYLHCAQLPERVPSGHALLHVEQGEQASAERVAAFLRAAAIEPGTLWLVLERSSAFELDGAREVVLAPLAEGEVRRLLEQALPGVRVSSNHTREAFALSGGLAGRLCRMLAHAVVSGAELGRAQSLRAFATGPGDGAEANSLSSAGRELLELLALAGGELEAQTAARALANDAELTLAYRELLGEGLTTLVGPRLALRADLIASERERLTPQRSRELAQRLPLGDLDGRARAYLSLARGDREGAYAAFVGELTRLRAQGKPEQAEACARDALALLGDLDRDARLRFQWVDALRAQGRYRAACELLQDAQPAPSLLGLRAELARLSGADDAEQLANAAREAGRDDPHALAFAEATLARLRYDRGELDLARALAEQASARVDPSSNGALRAQEVLALVHLHRAELELAAQVLRGAIERAASARLRDCEARLTALLGQLAREQGDVHGAARHYAAAFELAEAAGEQHAAAAFLHNVGAQRLDCGEPGPAIVALREAARRLARLGRDADSGRVLYNLGHAAQLIGQDDLALGATERAYEAALRAGDCTTQAYVTCLAAELRLKLGERKAALQLLARPLELATLPDAALASVSARICALSLALGERARAERAFAVAERAALAARSEDAEIEVALARCQLELESGRAEQAKLAAERGCALSQRGGSFDARLRATLAAARAARACADAGLAALRFSEVRSMLDQAARGLSASERAQLRAVDAYRAALEAAPSQGASARVPLHDDRWRSLAGMAKRLTAERREARLHEIVLDAALELTSAERGYILLKNHDGQPRVRAARGLERQKLGEEPSLSRSIVARVLGTGLPLSTMDAASDVELSGAASVHALSLRSVLAVPLRLRGEVLGAIYLEDRLRPFAFGEVELALLTDLCELASIALESSRLLRAERRSARRLLVLRARLARRVEAQAVEIEALRSVRQHGRTEAHGLIGHSVQMQRVSEMIGKVARASVPVLIMGESGTGKELVARAIHEESARKGATFVSENCGAIPEALLESALFGHVRGAFTGADRRRLGLFEIADGGTLFLDEIGEMTQAMQARLLRVLQDGEVRPLGGERARRVDVRVLCATHRDLPAMVAEGRFREDLYYRLAVMTLCLPALRERAEDIPALVAHFVHKHAAGRKCEIDKRALLALGAQAWPGNVRQLENEIRRALVLSEGAILSEHLSPALIEPARGKAVEPLDLRAQVDRLERKLIRQALDVAAGNQTQAARILGLSRYGLQKMIRRLERDEADLN